jgi:hypothetical protein
VLRNSSGSHGGSVLRAVGDDYEPGAFSTYSPCAIALIGKVPDTLHERRSNRSQARAIERTHEPVPLRLSRTPRFLARQAVRWCRDHADEIANADPAMPKGSTIG